MGRSGRINKDEVPPTTHSTLPEFRSLVLLLWKGIAENRAGVPMVVPMGTVLLVDSFPRAHKVLFLFFSFRNQVTPYGALA